MGKPSQTTMPEPPEHLDGAALEEWNRIAPILHASGSLDGLSVGLVAAYATTWGHYVHASEELQRHGAIRRALSGRVFVSVYYRVWLRTSRDLLRAATTLGLSPANRITR